MHKPLPDLTEGMYVCTHMRLVVSVLCVQGMGMGRGNYCQVGSCYVRNSLCMQKAHMPFLRRHPLHRVTSGESAPPVAATLCRHTYLLGYMHIIYTLHTCPASHSVRLLTVKISIPTSVCMYICMYVHTYVLYVHMYYTTSYSLIL